MKSVSYTAVLSIKLHFDEVLCTLRKWDHVIFSLICVDDLLSNFWEVGGVWKNSVCSGAGADW